jgi:hypothetical protein
VRERLTRTPRPGEIERAVAKAYGEKSPRPRGGTNRERFNYEELASESKRARAFDLAALRLRSPIDPDSCSAMDFLRHLFRPGERVFLADSLHDREGLIWEVPQADENPENELLCLADPSPGLGAWFLSNPITGEALELERLRSESNPKGWTVRAEECLTGYRYLLLESDQAPKDLWIKALALAPLPIVSITDSGGKSLHALVQIDAQTASEWHRIKELIGAKMVRLGADPQAMSLARLTRLPRVWRDDTGNYQRLLYLNPRPDRPIIMLPEREQEKGGGR